MYEEHLKDFENIFDSLSRKYNAHNIFYDFIKMCAIAIYNSFAKNEQMEKEYLKIINTYSKEDQLLFPKMFGKLIMAYEESKDITDILGPFYEKHQLGNSKMGQFFTPTHISDLMAEITVEDENKLKQNIKKHGFITMSEPTCGAGRYDIITCKNIKKKKYQLSTRLACIGNRFIGSLCIYDIYTIITLWNTRCCILWKYTNTRHAFSIRNSAIFLTILEI